MVHWLKMVEKDQDGGRKLTPQGQRDLDRIAGQVSGDFSHPPGASGAWILTVSSSGGYSHGSRGAGERTFLTDFPSWGLGDRLECRALGEGSPGPGCSQLGLFCRACSLAGQSVSPGQPSNSDCRVSSLTPDKGHQAGCPEPGLCVEAD